MATIISYPQVAQPASALPFISADADLVGNCWNIQPRNDDEGFALGELYAAHYLAFVQGGNCESIPGGLMQIVSSMAKRGSLDKRTAFDSSDAVAAGFLSAIDEAIRIGLFRTVSPEQIISRHSEAILKRAA